MPVRPPREDLVQAQEPLLEAARRRVRDAVTDLQKRGIVDEEGKRIRKSVPDDMRDGVDRDFGG
jgi:hypothetical protein